VTGPLAATKVRLRAVVRQWLAEVSSEERDARSERVVAALEAMSDVRSAATLLLHRSLPTEVGIDALLASALAREQRVFVPRIDGARLQFVRVDHETEWRRSKLGVLEPERGASLEGADFRRGPVVAIVPGLAFDDRGGRLGRGGGHYDRFLREARGEGPLRVIGVAFDLQIVAEVPRTDHDERVDSIVTESRVIAPRDVRRARPTS
jgi:5-formyltetrahydrofolate cyclo-ligase